MAEQQRVRSLKAVDHRVAAAEEARRAAIDELPTEEERLLILDKAAGVEGPSDIFKGTQSQDSNVIRALDEAEKHFTDSGAIEPPYNPATLTGLLEHSNALRQNVDAYATNIEGFGHRFEPVIDLKASDANNRIKQAMILERKRMVQTPGTDGQAATTALLNPIPSDDEINARRKVMAEEMEAEKTRLTQFFDFCVPDVSFPSFRKMLRMDREVIGNAYLEVLRNKAGEIAEFCYVPAFTVRLLPLDKKRTTIQERRKYSEIAFEDVERNKYFRRYVQIFESRRVFFKEFGDPRIMSAKTGTIFANEEDFLAAEGAQADPANPNQEPPPQATEIVHMAIHSPRSAYGVPRWIGVLLAVLGSRQAEEVNYLYFENKSIPPLAVLVSGGKLAAGAAKRLETFIESNLKGRKNFHRILILEAESTELSMDSLSRTTITLQPLSDAQQKDGLFLNYDEKNQDKIGMAFRLPRLLRGDIRDFNRATAEAALEFAEQQVFQPERHDFDFFMNRKILPALGIKYWKFTSNGPTTEDPELLSEILKTLVEADAITPEEARDVASIILKKDLKRIEADWVKQPTKLTLGGIPVQPDIPDSEPYGATPPLGGEWAPPPYQDPNAPPTGSQPGGDVQMDMGGATGTDQSGAALTGAPPGTVGTQEFQAGGALQPAQGGRQKPRRLFPKLKGMPTAEQAKAILRLRGELIHAQAASAAMAFYHEKQRELAQEKIQVPADVWASFFEKSDSPSTDEGGDGGDG